MSIDSLGVTSPQVLESERSGAKTDRKGFALLLCAFLLVAAAQIVWSLTLAHTWDEAFHLLAAQLIAKGRKPYLDFVFAQTPLNAYWNAILLRVFGEGWRAPHIAASLESAFAAYLTGDYVLRRFPVPGWSRAAAFTAVCLVGLNAIVVEFGTVAQAYGAGLVLAVIAFRFAIAAADRRTPFSAGLAGLASGAAAGSTLLTAPVAPVLLIWLFLYNRAGKRLWKATAFIAGVLISFVPLLVLFMESPRQVIFGVIRYHLFYRQVKWSGAFLHNLQIYLSWVDTQALILVALAIAGVLFIRRAGNQTTAPLWDARLRSESLLCIWLVIGLSAYLVTVEPTFQRYFVFAIPFLAIPALTGLYAVGLRTDFRDRPQYLAAAVCLLMTLTLVRELPKDKSDYTWKDMEAIAKKVNQVTPPGAPLYADEHIYFLTGRTPPSGMEYDDSHKLDLLSPTEAALMHVIRQTDLDREVKAGKFATAQTCDSDDEINRLGLPDIYRQKDEIADCTVFWDGKK